MGISGLHSVIKPYLAQSHARHFRGCRLGIDAWAWLHRGAVGAARQLATGERPWEARGQDPPYVAFCLRMVAMLRSVGVVPVLVFDGCRLPAKAGTNAQRRQRRAEAREKALKLLQEGRQSEAQGALMQCVDVTPEMAHELIVRLREMQVECLVAPYEADAQLAYLASLPEQDGGVAAVVTEDSDLVGYGCPRILFKMDSSGYCWEFALDRLFAGPQAAPAAAAAAAAAESAGGDGEGSCENTSESLNGSSTGGGSNGSRGSKRGRKGGKTAGKSADSGFLDFRGWTVDMLQAACVLAGCDFLPSLKGISFRTAAGFVARRRSLAGALRAIQAEKRFREAATPAYCAAAEAAALNFKLALVFCPNTDGGSLRRLTLLPAPAQQQEQGAQDQGEEGGQEGAAEAGADGLQEADLAHLGAELDAEVARGLAYGRLHPHTLQPFPAIPRPAVTTQQVQQQHHHHHQHRQQQQKQQQTSTAKPSQLASWMAGAAHQPGRGPAHQQQQQVQQLSRHHPQQQHRTQPFHHHPQQEQQQHSGVNVSDVLRVYQPTTQPHSQPHQPTTQQRSGEGLPAHHMPLPLAGSGLGARNPFARPTAAAAAPGVADGQPQHRATVAVSGGASAAELGCRLEAPHSDTQASAAAAPASANTAAALRPALDQPVVAQCSGPAGGGPGLSRRFDASIPAAMPSQASSNPQPATQAAAAQQHQQQQPEERVWDGAEQFRHTPSQHHSRQHARAWSTPPASALTGSKRKSSGGSAGGSAGKAKKGGKALAPPSQRISRFFAPQRQ